MSANAEQKRQDTEHYRDNRAVKQKYISHCEFINKLLTHRYITRDKSQSTPELYSEICQCDALLKSYRDIPYHPIDGGYSRLTTEQKIQCERMGLLNPGFFRTLIPLQKNVYIMLFGSEMPQRLQLML